MSYYRARRILMEMLTKTESPMETVRAEALLDALPVEATFLAVRTKEECIATVKLMKA